MTDIHSLEYAMKSLDGRSVGDAFGELFFRISPFDTTFDDLPKTFWMWTDDTHIALSIFQCLKAHKQLDQDALAVRYVRRKIYN